jgi:hypothetical protein
MGFWALRERVCRYNRCVSNAVKVYWALWDNLYEYVCCYNRYSSNAVEGLWDLWNNIYDYARLLL